MICTKTKERRDKTETCGVALPGIADILTKHLHNDGDNSQSGLWLIKSIDNALLDSGEDRHGSEVFHPSSFGNPCDRYLYLNFHGLLPLKKIDAQLRRIFDHGNITEERYSKYFEKMRVVIGREVRARLEDPPIHGRADFHLYFQKYGHVLIELKTINDAGFKKLIESQPGHRMQLQSYLNILNIDTGIVLYENKNNQAIKAFQIKKSIEDWADILERCKKIQSMSLCPLLSSLKPDHDRNCECLSVKDKNV